MADQTDLDREFLEKIKLLTYEQKCKLLQFIVNLQATRAA